MCAAILAALIAAVLSLGGASLVLAGQGGNGNGNGNGQANHDFGGGGSESAPAPAPASGDQSAPASHGKSQSRGNSHDGGSDSVSAPAPKHDNGSNGNRAQSAPKHAGQPAPKHASASAPSSGTSAPNGGGSHSTATSGPGNSSQGCDGSHNSNTGHGANHSGPYDNTCDGSPSGNGNGNGKATGKPCAGCVGNADDKNPKGQYPNGSDHNAGYECDRNHGIGRTNPAHTGCRDTTTPAPSGGCTGDMSGGNNSGACTPPPNGGCKGDMSSGQDSNCGKGDQSGNAAEQHGCPDAAMGINDATDALLHAVAVAHPELASQIATLEAVHSDNGCGRGHQPITICHATGSATNPYVEITIDINGLHGHGDHQDDQDIIPAPAGGCPGPASTPTPPSNGQEGEHQGCPAGDMNGNGAENGNGSDNGCGHTPITICHATGSATNPYVEITIDENGLHGHGDHADDIIPAPAAGCPAASTPPSTPATPPSTPPAGGEQPSEATPPTVLPTTPGTPLPPATVVAPTTAAGEQPAPAAPETPATAAPGQQAVLGERVSGSTPAPAPATGGNEVLGEHAAGGSTAPAAASAPAAAQRTLPAGNSGGSLPFTGTDALLVLFLGCLMVLGGFTLQRLTRRRTN